MQVKTMTKTEAAELYEHFVSIDAIDHSVYNNLNSDYQEIREELLNIETTAMEEKNLYKRDLTFACYLYDYLNEQSFFNETLANDIGFWIYLCVAVVPDIVFRRFGFSPEHFFEKNGRIYLQSLWLYIHMSYQGNTERTYYMLEHLSTDYILQMAERTGRDGFYVEVYREIMRIISSLPVEVINKQINGANLLRRVMIQNTAKTAVYNLVAENKIHEYVSNLFSLCKVEVKDYE